jgi:hypothetical protein
MHLRKTGVIMFLVVAICLFATLCTLPPNADGVVIRNVYGEAFTGSEACRSCHADLYRDHIHTGHYRDSRPATNGTIRGSFEPGRDSLEYQPSEVVRMQRADSSFYQVAYKNGGLYRSERFDLVIGSARKGQSYLYWKGQKLYQLPVSYFTPGDSWCKSPGPGYAADTPVFDRPVPAQCLECHTTHAQTVFGGQNATGDFFDKQKILYGIDCERCHGPGAAHVAFHTAHPGEKQGVNIRNAGRMTRQQRLDACALCHSGSRVPLKPAFSFRVGDRLDEFSQAKYEPSGAANLDVHGNQYGLLSASKCFINSQMDCSTCHSIHVNEAGNLKAFSQRCMSCHNGSMHKSCTVQPKAGLVLSDNCIDCHMPALPSQRIILQFSKPGDTTRFFISNLVRTHRIAIYRH